MQNLDGPKGRIDRFEKVLDLKGNLSNEQKHRLLEIASKCRVHKILDTPQEFATKLLEDEDWTVH